MRLPVEELLEVAIVSIGAGRRAQEVTFVPSQLRCALFAVGFFLDLADFQIGEQGPPLEHILRGHIPMRLFDAFLVASEKSPLFIPLLVMDDLIFFGAKQLLEVWPARLAIGRRLLEVAKLAGLSQMPFVLMSPAQRLIMDVRVHHAYHCFLFVISSFTRAWLLLV